MTQKSEEMQRMERDLNEQAELREKLDAEIKRIAEAGEAECDGEAMVKAAAAMGYTLTLEELERAAADLEKLDDDELETAGGKFSGPVEQYRRPEIKDDEKGHAQFCAMTWHCFTAFMHTETQSKNVACWENYSCYFVSKDSK
jgi:hypothetical protein